MELRAGYNNEKVMEGYGRKITYMRNRNFWFQDKRDDQDERKRYNKGH